MGKKIFSLLLALVLVVGVLPVAAMAAEQVPVYSPAPIELTVSRESSFNGHTGKIFWTAPEGANVTVHYGSETITASGSPIGGPVNDNKCTYQIDKIEVDKPGTYTFQVKIINNVNGEWPSEVVTVTITDADCQHTNNKFQSAQEGKCGETVLNPHFLCLTCGSYSANRNTWFAKDSEEYKALEVIVGHDFKKAVKAVPATCEKEGHRAYKQCSKCDGYFEIAGEDTTAHELSYFTVEKLKHTYGDTVEAKDPTCTEGGWYAYRLCSTCGKYYDLQDKQTDNAAVGPLGHDWKPGDKDAAGVAFESCDRCGLYRVGGEGGEEVDAIPSMHQLAFRAGTPAKCGKAGVMDYWECTEAGCGAKFASLDAKKLLETVEIPALKHEGLECVSGTSKYWQCEHCGVCFNDEACTVAVILPDGEDHPHVLLAHDLIPASCAENGKRAYWECVACDKIFGEKDAKQEIAEKDLIVTADVTKATSHVYTLVEVPETEEHRFYYQCSNCGMCFDGKSSNANLLDPSELGNTGTSSDHELRYQPGYAATCLTDGQRGYWKCFADHDCDKRFADKEGKVPFTEDIVIPAAHQNTIYFKGLEATAEAEGQKGYDYCTVCQMVKLDGETAFCTLAEARERWTIEKINEDCKHEQENLTVHEEVPATCNTDGMKKHYTCDLCNVYLDETQTKVVTEEELVIAADPSKHSDPLGHEGETDTTKEYWYCTICGQRFEDADGTKPNNDISKPSGGDTCQHEPVLHAKVPATCKKAGTRQYYSCKLCNKLYLDEAMTKETTLEKLVIPVVSSAHSNPLGYVPETATELEYWYCTNTGCGKRFADAAGTKPIGDITKPTEPTEEDNKLEELWGDLSTKKREDHG